MSIDLSGFTGTTQYFRHAFGRMVFTDGVRYFAEAAGAFWFLDIVATELIRLGEAFVHIRLTVAEGQATAAADDGNDRPLWKKGIPFTDCPPGEYRFYLIDRVLLLPSEY
jgi:hypothetical protein